MCVLSPRLSVAAGKALCDGPCDQLPEGWDWVLGAPPTCGWVSSVLWSAGAGAGPGVASGAGAAAEVVTPLDVLTELC